MENRIPKEKPFFEDLKLIKKKEWILYGVFALVGIIIIQQLIKNIKNYASTLTLIFITLVSLYVILKYDIFKKKKETKKLLNFGNEYLKNDINKFRDLKLLYKNDLDAFKIYKDLIDLYPYNSSSFKESIQRYNEFIKIKKLILESGSINLKNLYETLDIKINYCLNELLAVSKNSTDEDLIRIQSAITMLYKHIYNKHMVEVHVFLKEKWDNEEIKNYSFPFKYKMTTVKPSYLETKYYSENYSVY